MTKHYPTASLALGTAMALVLAAPLYAQSGASQSAPSNQSQPAGAQQNNTGAGGGTSSGAQINVQQPPPNVTVQQPAPEVTVRQPEPKVTVQQPEPNVTVEQSKPNVTVQQSGQPNVNVERPGQADVTINQDRAGANQDATRSESASGATSSNQPTGSGVDSSTGAAAAASPFDSMRVSDVIGTDIHGAQGEEIGSIEDIVMNRNGNAKAALVDVGGFLGIGAKRVAIPMDRLSLRDDRVVATAMTKEQIEQLPEYDDAEWNQVDRGTTIGDASID